MINRKNKILIVISTLLFLPLFLFAEVNSTSESNTIVNQLSAPLIWKFDYDVKTVGQAINQILKATNLKLSPNLSFDVVSTLNQSLPDHLRILNAMSAFHAIKLLTGSQVFIITPELNEISFSFDRNLSRSDLQIHTIKSSLQKYLDRINFDVRVSTQLASIGLSARPKRKEVIQFNKSHPIYFGFNDKDKIISIARNQREADALAKKDISVFFARAGDTIKQTIVRWASLVKLKTYYLAKKDLIIVSSGTFFGSLTASDGALAKLLESASESGLNIKAKFNSNNVLVIKDNKYLPILLTGNSDIKAND